MRIRAILMLSLLGTLAPASQIYAQGPSTGNVPTIEQSLSVKTVSSPRMAVHGKIAYVVREANWEENAYETEIWIADPGSTDAYQLTNAKKSSSAPAWSPDGKWLAFLSDRPAPEAGKGNGRNQIYLIRPQGGEARLLTKSETGVQQFEWSRDGKHIAFIASDPEDKAAEERKKKYGEFDVVQQEYTFSHLWLLAVNADDDTFATPQRLTEGRNYTVGGLEWSPDSTRIAFTAQRDPDLGSNDTQDIYVLTLADKAFKKIVDLKGPDGNPIWSPDGKQIAFTTANGDEYFYYNNRHIAIVDAAGGTPKVYTGAFDELPGLLAWGSKGILFSGLKRTASHLYHFDPATARVTQLSNPDDLVLSQFTFHPSLGFAACVAAGPNEFPEIRAFIVSPFKIFDVTDMTAQIYKWNLAQREVIEWKSTDGTPIEGVLYKPRNFDPAKKYPLLVVIHGGPTGVDRATIAADSYYPIEKFVEKGALVLRPNYRGSAGYGEKFRALNVRNLGVGDYADVISGVDFLISKGWVDPARVGSMGWSQGGYISAFITTFSDRFKAVSVGAGISNWMTYYVNTDIHPFTRQYLKATPWDDPEIYAKTSPMTYIKKAKTPTLIQHGEFDRRVPIPNAYELYQGLQDQGVPVKLIVYKGFGHGINKPKQQRAVMEHNWAFFLEHIWGEKIKTGAE